MHTHSLDKWIHRHVFLGKRHGLYERRTWMVVGITATMMIAEIVAGTVFGSMALLADGWHMATHAAAIGIAAFAYRFARTPAHDSRFTIGTGKVGDLAAFASAIILGLIAILIAWESAVRLYSPIAIQFGEATLVAVVGLVVNLVCACLFEETTNDHGHHITTTTAMIDQHGKGLVCGLSSRGRRRAYFRVGNRRAVGRTISDRYG
jgi:cation diffusion facilitator family transporter